MIRIVLIDDHKIILDGMHALLSEADGISIEKMFVKPQEALDYLDKNYVDIVITDLDMNELHGEDVVRYCKSKFPSTKIIVLSMHQEKAVIKHLISLGTDGYLSKSAGRDEIIRALKIVDSGSKYYSNEVMQSLVNDEQSSEQLNPVLDILTSRELETIKHIASGLSSKQIGQKLHISPRTVETHRNNILKKLNVSGIAGIVRFAFEQKIIA